MAMRSMRQNQLIVSMGCDAFRDFVTVGHRGIDSKLCLFVCEQFVHAVDLNVPPSTRRQKAAAEPRNRASEPSAGNRALEPSAGTERGNRAREPSVGTFSA
ncbi:uncharacterized protein V6R79_019867 [Siganus canaliculatus]